MKILIAQISRGSYARCEIGSWLAKCREYAFLNNDHLIDCIIDQEPTPAARNNAVEQAKRLDRDLLIMIDNDMLPNMEWFAFVCSIYRNSKDPPMVIGSPYRGGEPERLVQVLDIDLKRVTLEDANKRFGCASVRCCGTGLIAIDMEVFDKIKHPYFDYVYTDETHSDVQWTEDFYFTNKVHEAEWCVNVTWDHWSGHDKSEIVSRPAKPELEK